MNTIKSQMQQVVTQIETPEQELTRLRQENIKLKQGQAAEAHLGFKVTEKGGVSCYGLGRFPVTLYAAQWEKLFAKIPALQEFLKINQDKLSVKPPKAVKEIVGAQPTALAKAVDDITDAQDEDAA